MRKYLHLNEHYISNIIKEIITYDCPKKYIKKLIHNSSFKISDIADIIILSYYKQDYCGYNYMANFDYRFGIRFNKKAEQEAFKQLKNYYTFHLTKNKDELFKIIHNYFVTRHYHYIHQFINSFDQKKWFAFEFSNKSLQQNKVSIDDDLFPEWKGGVHCHFIKGNVNGEQNLLHANEYFLNYDKYHDDCFHVKIDDNLFGFNTRALFSIENVVRSKFLFGNINFVNFGLGKFDNILRNRIVLPHYYFPFLGNVVWFDEELIKYMNNLVL